MQVPCRKHFQSQPTGQRHRRYSLCRVYLTDNLLIRIHISRWCVPAKCHPGKHRVDGAGDTFSQLAASARIASTQESSTASQNHTISGEGSICQSGSLPSCANYHNLEQKFLQLSHTAEYGMCAAASTNALIRSGLTGGRCASEAGQTTQSFSASVEKVTPCMVRSRLQAYLPAEGPS